MICIKSKDDADKATMIRNLIDVAFKGGGLQFAKQFGPLAIALDEEIVEAGKAWEAAQATAEKPKETP